MKRQCKEDYKVERKYIVKKGTLAFTKDHVGLQLSLSVPRDINLPCTELNSIFWKFWNLKKRVNSKSILISTAMAFSIFGWKAVTLLSCYNGPFPLVDHVTGWQIKSFLFCHVNHFFDLFQWCNFSGIEALEFSCFYTRVCSATADVFPVVGNTRTKSIQKQKVSSSVK